MSEKSVVNVEGGEHHTIVVTSEGVIYTFGRNEEGQLGIGDTYTEYSNKQREKLLKQLEEDNKEI